MRRFLVDTLAEYFCHSLLFLQTDALGHLLNPALHSRTLPGRLCRGRGTGARQRLGVRGALPVPLARWRMARQ